MVPREGLEPPTLTLEPSCSNPLSYRGKILNIRLVRAERIELSSLAWKAGILAIIRRPQVSLTEVIIARILKRANLDIVDYFYLGAKRVKAIGQVLVATVDRIDITKHRSAFSREHAYQ